MAGVACILAGLVWSAVWPMNKTVWSGSFAVFAAGGALVILAFCEQLTRVGVVARMARPFEWLGVNALAIYIGSELIGHLLDRPLFARATGWASGKDIVFWHWMAPAVGDSGGRASSLVYGITYAMLWTAVAAVLYRRHVRFRV